MLLRLESCADTKSCQHQIFSSFSAALTLLRCVHLQQLAVAVHSHMKRVAYEAERRRRKAPAAPPPQQPGPASRQQQQQGGPTLSVKEPQEVPVCPSCIRLGVVLLVASAWFAVSPVLACRVAHGTRLACCCVIEQSHSVRATLQNRGSGVLSTSSNSVC